MNVLLDTHVALWAITDSPKLALQARELIELPSTTVWVSAVSLWEVSIKFGLGRGDMPISGKQALRFLGNLIMSCCRLSLNTPSQ